MSWLSSAGRRWFRASERAGFRAIEIKQAYRQLDGYPTGSHLTRMACYLTSPAVEAEIRDIVTAEAPDLLLIDGMFPAALVQAAELGLPSVVFVHTFVFRQLDMWRRIFATLSDMRQKAGHSPLPATRRLVAAAQAA